MTPPDWQQWHERYDDPSSSLSRRLAVVRDQLAMALASVPPGPIRLVSMCAGQGRDVLGTLPGHDRAGDVRGRLVELDEHLAAQARAAAGAFPGIEVVHGDAGRTDAYLGAVPADVVLACGVFGNVTDASIEGTIAHLPMLCAPGAFVIWTRHRREPDLTSSVRSWFAEVGFEEVAFVGDEMFGVGTHRLVRPPDPFRSGIALFEFEP